MLALVSPLSELLNISALIKVPRLVRTQEELRAAFNPSAMKSHRHHCAATFGRAEESLYLPWATIFRP